MAQSKSSASKRTEVDRKLAIRWGNHRCFFRRQEGVSGWVGVPVHFLRLYGSPKLPFGGLTASEAMFVLQLMSHKWDKDDPFPSYQRLADRMGITDKQARRYAQSIEKKGLLKRTERTGSSNSFDLSPLFKALHSLLKEERLASRAKGNVVELPKRKKVAA